MSWRACLLLLLLVTVGCSFATPAPIEERPWWLPDAPNRSFLRTIFGVIYVPPGQLAAYTRPPLSIHAAALLEHERLHAARQHEVWMLVWHLRYLGNASFRWKEERLGYREQLLYLARRGAAVRNLRAWFVATVTDPYYAGMASAEEAGTWFDRLLIAEGL